MITTLSQFLGSLPRNTYFVSEPEADGSRCYFPIEDLQAPGDDPLWSTSIIVLWTDEHTALISHPEKPDPKCNAIMNMAEMTATLNESWKLDGCMDAEELLKEGMEYAQLDFDRPQPSGTYWTDDEQQYLRIFATAYARAYRQCVQNRKNGHAY